MTDFTFDDLEFYKRNIKLDFFDDIEDNSSFSFIFDDNDVLIPVKETKYHLFSGDIYPFAIYNDELEALNQYFYETVQIIKYSLNEAFENFEKYHSMDERKFDTTLYTKYEMLMSCEHIIYTWKRIAWYSSSHFIVLLHSFLERALKKLLTDMFSENEKKIYSPKKKIAKVFLCIERIFDMSIDDFSKKYNEIYQQLVVFNEYRNKTVHGEFKINKSNNENNVYEEVYDFPPFKLIEIIDTISTILDMVEWQYSALNKTD